MQKPTDGHRLISYGKREWKILQYMFIKRGERFNKSQASRDLGITRSSIYDCIRSMESKGLVRTPHAGHNVITKKGIHVLNQLDGGVETSQGGCREAGVGKLSQHNSRFTMKIVDRSTYHQDNIIEIGGTYRKIEMNNWPYDLIKFGEDSISINPHTVIIRVTDIISDESEETMFRTVLKALEYAEKVKKMGIKTEGFTYEGSHWARIDSYLGRFMKKIDDKYFLQLQDGQNFWIDNSHGLEDETDSVVVRDNIDHNMHQLLTDKFDFLEMKKDNDLLYKMLCQVTKAIFEQNQLIMNLHNGHIRTEEPALKPGRPGYIG